MDSLQGYFFRITSDRPVFGFNACLSHSCDYSATNGSEARLVNGASDQLSVNQETQALDAGHPESNAFSVDVQRRRSTDSSNVNQSFVTVNHAGVLALLH